jgi:hypothetical protein
MTLIRVGMVFILSGILVGLLFNDWFPILFTGILLLVSEIVRRVIVYHWNMTNIGPESIPLLQPRQEEI